MQIISEQIVQAVDTLYDQKVEVVLTRPDPQFGDFATNVALQISKKLNKNPREVADAIVQDITAQEDSVIAGASVAGPGFINITIENNFLLQNLSTATLLPQTYKDKVVVAEYSDPNPFKVLHAGHLYTSVVGDAIANLLDCTGAAVHRVNFGGDVGLHVGKTLYRVLKRLGGENVQKLQEIAASSRSEWLAECYVEGTNDYEDDEEAKIEITKLNKRVYELHAQNDHDSPFAQIYWTTRQWSYDYFDAFYDRIGTKFEKYYPESSVAELGLKTVKEHIQKGIFEQSEGAVVFKGEPYGLHTRVFINKEGLPTYEAKDVGLIMTKKQEYDFDMSVVITGNEQLQYMAVVLKAVEQFAPELTEATSHLTHGMVKLKGNVKMSSRKGNILRATDILDIASAANKQATGKDDSHTILGAVKYAFLKVRTGGDIVYDPEESVALEGNSGPYIQYAHARARSILDKSAIKDLVLPTDLQPDERALVSKITEYTSVIERATHELSPHSICTYLYELAQQFNRFYEGNRVIADPRESQRIYLVAKYAEVLKSGLGILGIHAPESM
ncbi:MAG: arginyl-tRNA synthetase [Patescibacteria group bacterium]|jgi:arginyl-tRNA synthetase|nr:arginyl-tRNA synthetase [Patescibacteria group bacterium]